MAWWHWFLVIAEHHLHGWHATWCKSRHSRNAAWERQQDLLRLGSKRKAEATQKPYCYFTDVYYYLRTQHNHISISYNCSKHGSVLLHLHAHNSIGLQVRLLFTATSHRRGISHRIRSIIRMCRGMWYLVLSISFSIIFICPTSWLVVLHHTLVSRIHSSGVRSHISIA